MSIFKTFPFKTKFGKNCHQSNQNGMLNIAK